MTPPRVKLDIDATRQKLTALGLGYAIDALECLLSEAVRTEMPAHVFLDRLLDAERSGREERRVRTMLKTAKIPNGVTLESAPLSAIDGVDGSRFRHRNVPHWVLSHKPMKGAIHERDYHDRPRSGQERVPGSWG